MTNNRIKEDAEIKANQVTLLSFKETENFIRSGELKNSEDLESYFERMEEEVAIEGSES